MLVCVFLRACACACVCVRVCACVCLRLRFRVSELSLSVTCCVPLQCVSTLKGHEERVWTVAMAKARETIPGDSDGHVIVEREMVSGGGDSVLCVWADATREEEAEARAAADAAVLQQQELYNRMAARDYPRTVELCIKYVCVCVRDGCVCVRVCVCV
ncbi:MAG: WD40 repeat domain-containing protein [Terracidiphilus sp.]|nr:WD40 repeat domain-containing protein [Terracidiphilus sp.]